MRPTFQHVLGASLLTALLFAGTGAAEAAFTTEKCLAAKAKAWGKLRQCERGEDAKRLLAKRFDLAKCRTTHQEQLAKSDAKAGKAGVGCRFGNNGDSTVTDYDTGLQWARKIGVVGGLCPVGNPHCVNSTFEWDEAQRLVAGTSADGTTPTSCFAGYCDWRLPTIGELEGIRLEPTSSCSASPCIDPTFGPTVAGRYWTSTSLAAIPTNAFAVSFGFDTVLLSAKTFPLYARGVRSGL